MKLKLHNRYLIVWNDAWSTDIDWCDSCSVKDFIVNAENHSLGYLIYQDKEIIIIAQNFSVADKRFSTLTGIPVKCISKISTIN